MIGQESVGKDHPNKVDDFMMKHRGGRSIEPVKVKKIVILGAGVAGLRVALNLEKRVSPHLARIIIIDENSYHQYLYRIQKVCNERYEDSEIIVPLSRLLRDTKRTKFVQATVKSIDTNRRIVETTDGELYLDILVIALGSKTEYFGIPDLEENSLNLNSFEDAKRIRSRIVECFEGASQPPKIVIGGAGMTGVELAGEIADWYPLLCRAHGLEAPKNVLTLVELTRTIISGWDEGLIRKGQKKLRELGVEIIFNDPRASRTSTSPVTAPAP